MHPPSVSTLRLYILRAYYALIAVGLAVVVWPDIISPSPDIPLAATVVRALLGGVGLLALLGLRYPLRMIPLLLFELVWKTIWVVAYALPWWQAGQLTPGAADNLFDCGLGIVLTVLVLPWRYVAHRYLTGPGEPWRARPALD